MKTLSDFKRRIQVGTKLETIHHKNGNLGVREVGHVQSNSFALNTQKGDKTVLSWCQYPKAKDVEVKDENTITFFWGEGEKREPILTYKFV